MGIKTIQSKIKDLSDKVLEFPKGVAVELQETNCLQRIGRTRLGLSQNSQRAEENASKENLVSLIGIPQEQLESKNLLSEVRKIIGR